MKRSINILPPEEQKINRVAEMDEDIRNFGSWLVLSLVLLAIILALDEFLLLRTLQGKAEEVLIKNQELAILKKTPLRKQMEELNQDLQNLDALSSKQIKWSVVFREIAAVTPQDVTLDNLSVATDGKLELSGHAATRNSVLQLRKNLLSSPYFKNVNFPLANLEKEKDLRWKYKLFVNLNGQS